MTPRARAWTWAALSLIAASTVATGALAQERVLEAVEEVHGACRRSEAPGRRELLVLEVPIFRFGTYDPDDERLPVDTTRNLRALGGAVEVLPAELEEIAFVASPSQALRLRRHARALRVGFFLGFDGRGQACVIRSAVGVTLVRAELAFAELVDAQGGVAAREDTERLRAWLDDTEHEPLEGAGPRVAVRDVSVERGGVVSDATLRSEELRRALDACHALAVSDGAPGEAVAYVRLRTDASGRVVERAFDLSDLAVESERACVLDAIGAVALPPGERVWRVQLRFAN